MRIIWTAASVIAVGAASIAPASAQTHVMRGGAPMAPPVTMPSAPRMQPMMPNRGGTWTGGNVRGGGQVRTWTGRPPMAGQWTGGRWNNGQWAGGGSRWGNRIGGRWQGGVQAPGGWNAYRQPNRGWALPSYWFAPSFFINDYAAYGLGAPPSGYNWTRYYDDAVLVDGRGRVYDSVNGLDWDRYDNGYAYDDSYDDGERYYADGVDDDYGRRGPDVRRDDRRRDGQRRDSGIGGAVVGGVVGGVAGNLIAGRGNRLGGTLIGAGVGAIAGAVIDRAGDGRRDRRDRRDARYDDRGAPYGYPDRGPPPPPYGYAPGPGYPPAIVRHGGGYDTRVYTSGGYAGYGYGYYGGTTTTVTVLPTTTTTTETITVYDTAQTRTRTWRAPVKRTKILRRTPTKILSRGCNC